VHALQTASNPRRAAIRLGVAKRNFRFRSRYLLGGTLVCAGCGSNYIGDGRTDYVCPAHTTGHCGNDMRFRRTLVHQAVVDLLTEHLLSPNAIERGRQHIQTQLRAATREEEASARRTMDGAQVRKLDAQAAALRGMDLPPSAITAALAELQRQREALLAQASGRCPANERRAEHLLARLPAIVDEYKKQVQQAVKVLAKPQVVAEASEAVRRLLADGSITLAPNADRTGVVGPVHFRELGDHVLQLAGWQRNRRDINDKLSGSGGRI
jgi:hypothetical protein